jgi:UDP-2,3-diacylglucosamine hydrolase
VPRPSRRGSGAAISSAADSAKRGAGRIARAERASAPVAFISDLHLAPGRDRVNEIFFRLLRDGARGAGTLYILGDLFDAWIGDDDREEPLHGSVIEALRTLSDEGCRILLMHGNRDFLIGESFAEAAGLELLPDPTVIELFGERALLMHGDTLCTEDVAYQAFRSRVRNPQVQRDFLAKPLDERRSIALGLQQENAATKQAKTAEIMDVTPGEDQKALKAYDCRLLIHGHTHRPARHDVVVDGRRCERWVLADWQERGEILQVSAEGITRTSLDL